LGYWQDNVEMGQEVSHFSTPSKTGSGSPYAISHPVGTLGSFLRLKRPEREAECRNEERVKMYV